MANISYIEQYPYKTIINSFINDRNKKKSVDDYKNKINSASILGMLCANSSYCTEIQNKYNINIIKVILDELNVDPNKQYRNKYPIEYLYDNNIMNTSIETVTALLKHGAYVTTYHNSQYANILSVLCSKFYSSRSQFFEPISESDYQKSISNQYIDHIKLIAKHTKNIGELSNKYLSAIHYALCFDNIYNIKNIELRLIHILVENCEKFELNYSNTYPKSILTFLLPHVDIIPNVLSIISLLLKKNININEKDANNIKPIDCIMDKLRNKDTTNIPIYVTILYQFLRFENKLVIDSEDMIQNLIELINKRFDQNQDYQLASLYSSVISELLFYDCDEFNYPKNIDKYGLKLVLNTNVENAINKRKIKFLEHQLSLNNCRILNLENENRECKERVSELSEDIKDYQEKTHNIDVFNKNISELNNVLREREKKINQLETNNNNISKSHIEKTYQIRELEERNKNLQQKITELNYKCNCANSYFADAVEKCNTLFTTNEKLECERIIMLDDYDTLQQDYLQKNSENINAKIKLSESISRETDLNNTIINLNKKINILNDSVTNVKDELSLKEQNNSKYITQINILNNIIEKIDQENICLKKLITQYKIDILYK